jgi:hypothetical protein
MSMLLDILSLGWPFLPALLVDLPEYGNKFGLARLCSETNVQVTLGTKLSIKDLICEFRNRPGSSSTDLSIHKLASGFTN